MRILLQRVASARVDVDGRTVGAIDRGLLALVGITHTDGETEAAWMAEKLLAIRLFPDAEGKMNLSLRDVGGGILLVSQFTLYGDLRKGTRPSFIDAAHPDHARPFFDSFVERVRTLAADSPAPVSVHTGIFGAMMDVHLVNDGPVTVILER